MRPQDTRLKDPCAAFLERLRRAVARWPSQVNPQELQVLIKKAELVPADKRFHVLAAPFIESVTYGGFLGQQYAGQILVHLKPPCEHQVDDVLCELLPNWNRSVEELPKYLAMVFGRNTLLTALDRLDLQQSVDPVLTNTVRFWLRLPPAQDPCGG